MRWAWVVCSLAIMAQGALPSEDEWLILATPDNYEASVREECRLLTLSDKACQGVIDMVQKAGRSGTSYFPITMNHTVSLAVKLRTGNQVDLKTLQIGINQDKDRIINELCREYRISQTNCENLHKEADELLRKKKAFVQSLIQQRLVRASQSIEALVKNESNLNSFQVISARHHIDAVLQTQPNNIIAMKLKHSLLRFGSIHKDIVAHLADGTQAGVIQEWKDLSDHRLGFFREALKRDFSPSLALSTIHDLTSIGHFYFHLGDTTMAKDIFSEGLSVGLDALKLPAEEQPTRTDLLKAMTNLMQKYLELLCGNNEWNQGQAVIETVEQAAIHAGAKLDSIPWRLYIALCFPLTYESSAEALERTKSAHSQLDEALAALKANPRPASQDDQPLPAFGFYTPYSGAMLGPSKEVELRAKISNLHRLITPSINFYSDKLERGSGSSSQPLQRVGFITSSLYDHSVGKLVCKALSEVVRRMENVRFYFFHIETNHNTPRTRPGTCKELWEVIMEEKERAFIYEIGKRRTPSQVLQTHLLLASKKLDIAVFLDPGLTKTSFFLGHGRFAPIQVAFWGHPVPPTFGSSMDVAIVPRPFVPSASYQPLAGSQERGIPICTSRLDTLDKFRFLPFQETVVCTETLMVAYDGHHLIPTAQDETSALQKVQKALVEADIQDPLQDLHIYFLPHKLMKIHPRMDEAIMEIASKDDKAVFLFSVDTEAFNEGFSIFHIGKQVLEKRLRTALPRIRLAWLTYLNAPEFLAIGKLASAVLESFGSYGSGVTAIEFLNAAVPIVAFPGNQLVSPNAHGFYSQIAKQSGLSWVEKDLSCFDPDDVKCFSTAALRLAHDKAFKEKWISFLSTSPVMKTVFSEDQAVFEEWTYLLQSLHTNYTADWHFKENSEGVEGVEGEEEVGDFAATKAISFSMSRAEMRKVDPHFAVHKVSLQENMDAHIDIS